MPLLTNPIDYDALRIAVLDAVALVTGLDANHMIAAEGEEPNWPRPSTPYLTYKLTSAAIDTGMPDEWIDDQYQYNASGMLSCAISLNTYGTTHEEAHNLMGKVRIGLRMTPAQQLLNSSNVALWNTGTILDLTELQDTGYLGRAQMTLNMGMASHALFTAADTIEAATIVVQADDQILTVGTAQEISQ